jgi:hypothetical protein
MVERMTPASAPPLTVHELAEIRKRLVDDGLPKPPHWPARWHDAVALLKEVDRLKNRDGYHEALARGRKEDLEWVRDQLLLIRSFSFSSPKDPSYKWANLDSDIEGILARISP